MVNVAPHNRLSISSDPKRTDQNAASAAITQPSFPVDLIQNALSDSSFPTASFPIQSFREISSIPSSPARPALARWGCWPAPGMSAPEFFRKGQPDTVSNSEIIDAIADFRCFKVIEPNAAMITAMAHEVGISEADLERALAPENRAAVYHRAGSLVVRLEEMVSSTERPGEIEIRPILVFCNKNRLVMITPRSGSSAVDRIWGELADRSVPAKDLASTNYILTRLFGAVLHTNETTISMMAENLKNICRAVQNMSPDEEAGARNFVKASQMSAALAQHSVNVMEPIAQALGEPSNTFGKSPREALGRYVSMVKAMGANLQAIDRLGALITHHWDAKAADRQLQAQEVSNAEERNQNRMLARLSVLGGLLGPLAVAVDFLQTPMTGGLSTQTQLLVLGGALCFSSILILGLRSRLADQLTRRVEPVTHDDPPPPLAFNKVTTPYARMAA